MGQSIRGVAAFQTEINSNQLSPQTLQVDQRFHNDEDTITVADYILSRLVETGVTVPLNPWNTPPDLTDTLV